MTNNRILELLRIERECIARGNTCGRDCASCELVQDDKELLEMYDTLIKEREEMKRIGEYNETFSHPDIIGLLWDGDWYKIEYMHDGTWEVQDIWQ